MSEELDFSKVGRNDPCPCGSGKKFKKCHFRKIELQKQTKEQTIGLDNFIKADQLPFDWFKGLQMIINRRDWSLMYQAIAPDSPARAKWPTANAFVEKARNSPSNVPGGGTFELRRFRLIEDRAFIMGARGLDDRRASKATYEVLALIETEEGYRITDIEQLSVVKADIPEDGDIPFENFPCVKAVYEAARAKPLVRPEFERWVPEDERPPEPEGEEGDEVAAEEAAEAAEGAAEVEEA